MSKSELRYVLSDAYIGIKRNKGGAIASLLFTALSMSFIGIFLLFRIVVGGATDYVSSQLAMKVYVSQNMSTSELATILEEKDFVKHVDIEKGEDLVNRLSFFFDKRAYLLDAFQNGQVNDAIRIQLKNSQQIDDVAQVLRGVHGIDKVVYPQELAQLLQKILAKMTFYGIAITAILLIVTFFMIYMTLHLALYKRHQELKVKLLVGMNPAVLRCQFLVEGFSLAIGGAIISTVVTLVSYHFFFSALQTFFVFLTPITSEHLWLCILIEILLGISMSLLASYLATRKWINNA